MILKLRLGEASPWPPKPGLELRVGKLAVVAPDAQSGFKGSRQRHPTSLVHIKWPGYRQQGNALSYPGKTISALPSKCWFLLFWTLTIYPGSRVARPSAFAAATDSSRTTLSDHTFC